MTYTITTAAAKYVLKKRVEMLEVNLSYAWLGAKIVQTAGGNSYNGAFVLGHADRQSLREFCRRATGKAHFHWVNALDFDRIGREAVKLCRTLNAYYN